MDQNNKTKKSQNDQFKLVYQTKIYGSIPIAEYKSVSSGLTVVIADVQGPLVSGFFCLATEAFDDDGLPHTLEHLIFLGSEDYPYKGVLDLLANRCFASGTNAWTAVDHTCYTLETAGAEGFLTLMPIYLDHILFPTLTDYGFTTEVHHISPTGDDGGVVYCEMQGRENSSISRTSYAMLHELYPGHCGYSSEVGGIMKNLRESTTNEKIKQYHKDFYRPENLKVIIVGHVDPDHVFEALKKIEAKIESKGPREAFQRPWQSPIPPLQAGKDLDIKYPTDDESNGNFCIAWRGPHISEQYTSTALEILLDYLTEMAVSPLKKEFVETMDPYASTVSGSVQYQFETCFEIDFEDVPFEKLTAVRPKLLSTLNRIAEQEDIDLDLIKLEIDKAKLAVLSMIENDPFKAVSAVVIVYMLYGNDGKDMESYFNPVKHLNKLRTEPKTFWVSLLKKYLLNDKYVSITAYPSISEKEKMTEAENKRIQEQKLSLGEEGLKIKAKILDEAVEFNSRELAPGLLSSVPMPRPECILFHKIGQYDSGTEAKEVNLSKMPIYTYLDDVKSNFVYMYGVLDTSGLPDDLRPYLSLYIESLFESPLNRNGKVMPFDQVVVNLNTDTISKSAKLGLATSYRYRVGTFGQNIVVFFMVEISKFLKGLEWLKDILYNTIFTEERLKIIAGKMLNSVAQYKTEGATMVDYALRKMCFVDNCNILQNSMFSQIKFLNDIVSKLESHHSSGILATFDKIKDYITDPNRFCLFIGAQVATLKHPIDHIQKLFPSSNTALKKLHAVPNHYLLKEVDSESVRSAIIGMGSLESSFFAQAVPCINNPIDPDLPALRLYLNYLTQAEGIMWRQIRGLGYSYSYGLSVNTDDGLLVLRFSKATNVVGAYRETKKIIQDQLKNKIWDQDLLDSSRCSLIYDIAYAEKTIGNVVSLSIKSHFQNVSFANNRKQVILLEKVTVDDLNRVGKKYLSPLFEANKVRTAVVIDSSKVKETQEGFRECGLDLKIYPTLDESFLNA